MSQPEHHDPHHQYRAAAHHKKKKQRLNHKQQELLAGVALGVVAVFFFGAIWLVGLKSSWSLVHPKPVQTNNNAPKTPITVTAPVQKPSFQITLQRHWSSVGGQSYKAGAGFIYHIVDVSVVQHSGQPKWLAPAIQSYIVDGSGQQYNLSPIDTEQPFVSRAYNSDETARGELGYETPNTAQNLKWCFYIDNDKENPLCAPLR